MINTSDYLVKMDMLSLCLFCKPIFVSNQPLVYNSCMWSRAVVEVDLEAVRQNICSVRWLVGSQRRVWPAVKANAYGHGAIPVGSACIQAGADGLCVATIQEAIELRQAGLQLPILVLGCITISEAAEAVRLGIQVTLCDLELAQELSRIASLEDTTARVHIKMDTGMGRIGLHSSDILEFAERVSNMPGLAIEGLFTHFPTADEEERAFTLNQIQTLKSAANHLYESKIPIPMVHAANSAGILAYPEGYLDGVRPGIMIYGQYPSPTIPKTVPLKQTFTLKSRIAFIKRVPPNTGVSYGRTHITKSESIIATVPIGYGDGYPRALSNKGRIVIRGKYAPIAGRICMDQLMIDTTNIPDAQVGDEVILYGGGYECLDAGVIAQELNTISYELFCNINARVPRIYINE